MSNKKFTPDVSKANSVINEINGKIQAYEQRMTTRLARWVEIAELYCGKTGTQKENSRLSPNSAELYKAVRAISNMQYRMLTGQKPFFELQAMDIIGYADPHKLLKAEHYITNQLDLSRYNKGLYRALVQLNLYGSVAVHEQYEPLRSSFLGKPRYITSFRPVSLVNCAFSLDAYDIEESGWVALSDIQSRSALNKIKGHDPEGKIYNLCAVEKAQNQGDYIPKVNNWVQQRMAWSGYVNANFIGGMERVTYYGGLDCMNDHEEYAVELVNREHIIRMESYDGIKPVRVATVNTLDVEPLGNGIGDQFRPLLAKIDDSESALLNMITLAGASMFSKQKSLTDEDSEFSIRNFGILNLESPELRNISPDPNNINAVSCYKEICTQQFRQGSGATDTLQALVSSESATATEVSLSMNEAVRNLSVSSESVAPILCADHIRVVLQNAQKYNTDPFVLHINKVPITILPSDLLIDVDVRVKTMTDQDFRPAKINKEIAALQLMMGAGPNAIPGHKINIGPVLLDVLKTLDVPNFNETVQPLTEEDLMQMQLMQQIQNPQPAGSGDETARPAERRVDNQQPGRKETREMNRNMGTPMNTEGTLRTPVGNVLSAPGDMQGTTTAIRQSTTGDNRK